MDAQRNGRDTPIAFPPMEQRHLGRSGLRVSRTGLGTLTWGRDTDEHEATEQLREFLDAGGTLLDTAAGFGGGASEELVGALLGDVVDRRDVVLCTKAGMTDGGPGAGAGGTGIRGSGVDASARHLLRTLDESLARLGTDHVDLWLVNGWDDAVPVEETLAALSAAVSTGRARYVGAGNYAGWQLARAATLAAARGAPLVADQVEYSLVERRPERDVVPAAAHVGVGTMARAPLGRGVLSGKYRAGTPADSRAASPHFGEYVRPFLGQRARRVVEAVATAADGLGCPPVQVALAWVRDAPHVATAVVGARTAEQLRGSLAAEGLELPAEIRQALDDVSCVEPSDD
jgi:aryl-alcohol dehydrogenase-like predicted oxidoreductase